VIVVKILVLHGPNLGRLGMREAEHYGQATLAELNATLLDWGAQREITISCHQSELEGELITWLHQGLADSNNSRTVDAIVINPGGYAHSSVAIRDAITLAVDGGCPVVEVHMSKVHAREEFRQKLLTGAAATGVITGFASYSYILGLEAAYAEATRTHPPHSSESSEAKEA